MSIRRLSHEELNDSYKRGEITADQLADEITRRSALWLRGTLARFVARQNAADYGAPEGSDGRH